MNRESSRGWQVAGCGALALLVVATATAAAPDVAPPPAGDTSTTGATRDRLRAAVEWLAGPDREGRGPGTQGIDAAA
ncbi:MAG: hypothetical protein ACK5SI_01925 [Planctomycetia bacterium]